MYNLSPIFIDNLVDFQGIEKEDIKKLIAERLINNISKN